MRIRCLIAAVVLAPTSVLVVAGTAWADQGNGATVTTRRECRTTPFGMFCINSHLVVNETETPSGNVSYTTNHHSELENNAFGCQFVGDSRTHHHFLLKDGELQEQGSHEDTSFSTACPGRPSMICTFTFDYHYANGTIQYSTTEFTCTET